jgi:hypothetical protein
LLTTTVASACPHCGKCTTVQQHPTLHTVCTSCRYPRLVTAEAEVVEPAEAQRELVLAYQQDRAMTAWRVGRLGLTVLGTVSASLALLFALNEPLSIVWRAVVLGLGFAPALPAVYAGFQARNLLTALEATLERARRKSAAAWYRASKQALSAETLGRSLGISADAANQHLIELELEDYVDAPDEAQRRLRG